MTADTIEQTTKNNVEALSKAGSSAEQILKSNADAIVKGGKQAEHVMKEKAAAVTQSGDSAISGFQELARDYQAVASRNAATLSASIHALAAVKTPMEFLQLQRKLIIESLESSARDFSHIAKLTHTVFMSSFEPLEISGEKMMAMARK